MLSWSLFRKKFEKKSRFLFSMMTIDKSKKREGESSILEILRQAGQLSTCMLVNECAELILSFCRQSIHTLTSDYKAALCTLPALISRSTVTFYPR